MCSEEPPTFPNSAHGSTAFGPCATLPGIYEAHQREVDSLGAALQEAMARSAR